VSLYDWLVSLHVLAAFSLVAAVVVYTYVIVAGRNVEIPSEVAALFRIARVGDVLMPIGAMGVLILGIWLAIEVDGYEVWDGWVIAALVLWAIFAAVGSREGKIYNAARDRARALVAEGNDAPSPALREMLRSRTGLALHAALIVVVVLFVVDMIYKPGA
jgi:uncharacterized membrane protein